MRKDLENLLISAIKRQLVLRFLYNGELRVVEPQACGISTAGKGVIRVYQREGGSKSGQSTALKLLEVAKISELEITGERFKEARPEHNPNDSAMIRVIAALAAPKGGGTAKHKKPRSPKST